MCLFFRISTSAFGDVKPGRALVGAHPRVMVVVVVVVYGPKYLRHGCYRQV